MGQQLVLHNFRQGVKLRLELLMEQDFPSHRHSMSCSTYVVKYMLRGVPFTKDCHQRKACPYRPL